MLIDCNEYCLRFMRNSSKIYLSLLVNAGWGNVYRADALRIAMASTWSRLPEKNRQEILRWEETELAKEVEKISCNSEVT